MAYKVKINFSSKSNQFSGYESLSTKSFKTKAEAQKEIDRLKAKMGKSKNSDSIQNYTIKQTERLSPKTKAKIKTTSATIGKRAWKFLNTPPPKKQKSAFDFFNV